MNYQMHDILLELPLFQGMAESDFSVVLEKVRLNFEKVPAGRLFIEESAVCHRIVFLLNGTIRSELHCENGKISFKECLDAPCMIEFSSLFGVNPVYRRGYTTVTPVGLLTIDKNYLYSELLKYDVVRMNILNLLSNRSHNFERMLWNPVPADMRNRFVAFLQGLSDNQYGEKEVQVRMEDLAELLGETRLNVSRMLNEMERSNLVQLRRGRFTVPHLEML